MKLGNLKKTSSWDVYGYYTGRYKNFTVKIVEGGDPWKRKREYYWVSLQSKKYEKGINSLWEDKKFNSVDEAKEYAISRVDTFIKELSAGVEE